MINLLAVLDGLERIKNLPWKGIVAVTSGSFLAASVLTVLLSRVLLPTSITNFKEEVQNDSVLLISEKPSLSQQDVDEILKRNIFNVEGKYGEDQDGGKSKPLIVGKDPIKSTLPLKLIGTIYGGDPKSGIALIEESSRQSTNSFFVGDTVAEGAILWEILREKVILDLGDHREYIELEPRLPAHRRSRGGDAKVGLINGQKKSRYATDPPPDRFKEEGFERNGTNMVLSSEYRKKMLGSDFSKVLQDAKAEPFMIGKELAGFRLTHIREESIYQKAGLQDGDVVREINGVSLVNTAQTIKLLNSLRGEDQIEIRLDRGGASLNMNIQVR